MKCAESETQPGIADFDLYSFFSQDGCINSIIFTVALP